MICIERPTWSSLAAKYRRLASLQRAHTDHGETATREVLQALATEFPGALRELDAVAATELDARAEALTAVAEGHAQPDAWMVWIRGYHALMRAALWVKFTCIHRGETDTHDVDSLVREVAEATGCAVDEAFVRASIQPAGGRLNPVVYARLGAEAGVPPSVVREALFPSRRGSVVASGTGEPPQGGRTSSR